MRAAHEAVRGDDFEFALGLTPQLGWAQWLQQHALADAGLGLAVDRVRATFLVAEVDGVIAGRVSIRHRLNEWLTDQGGHVGYAVVPAMRRRGIATELLRQSLIIARAFGVTRVLVCCDESNAGSAAVIESCGGMLDAQQPYGAAGEVRRYWID